MDAPGDATKERDEYYMMVIQIFESKEQGYEHYNGYAEAKGCSVRLDDEECHWERKNLKEDISDAQMKDTVCRSTLKLLTKRGSHGC
jgi:hypothetical protein